MLKPISVPTQYNYQFAVLGTPTVNQINSAEGNGNGNPILAQLIDLALSGGGQISGFAGALAGAVTSSDTVLSAISKLVSLQNGTPTPTVQTLAAAGAIDTVSMETLLNNGTSGSFAATLAAPSAQDGQLKIIKLGTATHTVTLAMTNIKTSGAYTPTGTTTLTFTSTGDCAVLMAVGSKWIYLGGSAVAS